MQPNDTLSDCYTGSSVLRFVVNCHSESQTEHAMPKEERCDDGCPESPSEMLLRRLRTGRLTSNVPYAVRFAMRNDIVIPMKNIFFILACFVLALCSCNSRNSVALSPNDDYVIVYEGDTSGYDCMAAYELSDLLAEIFGHEYLVVTCNEYAGGNAISIGCNSISQDIYNRYKDEIRDDGFLIHTENGNLYIFGNREIASLYGVYHLLENYLGCTYTCSNGLHIEKQSEKVVLDIHDLQNPSFRYRETLQLIPNADSRYAKWHKLHNRADFNNEWGLFVHTFKDLVPVSEYFDSHPEWFSEMHGWRVRDGQLCLSNPEVLEVLCKNLEAKMKENPDKNIWSVSQNDNESSCQCENCRRLDSIYGGPSGTMIWFVNQVAERFPDKVISTLAYQQTRHAPKNIKPAGNVNIMLCSIECPRHRPISADSSEHSFQRDLADWTALTHNIFLWDYVVQFRNYMDPFPNLHVIQPNLQDFYQHGIPMIFEQGSNQNITENYEWRTYLIAHLLWNVNLDVDSLRRRFLDAHYGKNRTEFVAKYYDTMQKALVESGKGLNIYGYPIDAVDSYLSPNKITEYRKFFASAYAVSPYDGCTAEDAKIYNDRLRLLEMPLDFAEIDLSMYGIDDNLSFFTIGSNGEKVVKPEKMLLAKNFIADCERLGVKQLDEAKYTPAQLQENLANFVAKSTGKNLALGKSVTCSTEWSNTYDVGGPKALTDGKSGVMNYYYNWLGFNGNDMDVVIDLESEQSVGEVSADFLFYPLSWIFAPKCVTCYLSADGKNWREVAKKSYENEESLAECKIVGFNLNFKEQKTRYVRLKAESLRVNPEWHRGVGQPCWIFCDEVVVR